MVSVTVFCEISNLWPRRGPGQALKLKGPAFLHQAHLVPPKEAESLLDWSCLENKVRQEQLALAPAQPTAQQA